MAFRLGERVSFAPIHEPNGVGNGTHIHWSFVDGEGQPVLYYEGAQWQLSVLGSHFVAGVLYHLPALCAVTAASIASYYRLRSNRWAPVKAEIRPLDRGAAVRIVPLFGSDLKQRSHQFNIEFRVADATANPYLTLAVLNQAGFDGFCNARQIDATHVRPLPTSLMDALRLLGESEAAAEWLGAELLSGYLLFKRAEAQSLQNLDEKEICRRYTEVY